MAKQDLKNKHAALVWATGKCAQRECCESDIVRKLSEHGLGLQEIDEIIIYLTDNNYLSEERYARAFVHDKFYCSSWGRIKIQAALRQKKISSSCIAHAFEQLEEQTYRHRLKELLERKHQSLHYDHNNWTECQKTKQQLLRFALSRGFEAELIFQLIEKITKNNRFSSLD